MDQKQFGEEHVYLARSPLSIVKENKGKNTKSEPGGRYWLALPGSLSVLSYTAENHQPRGSTPSGRVPPHYLLIKKMSHRLADRPIQWRHFLSLSFLFPDDSSFSHSDRNQPAQLCLYK